MQFHLTFYSFIEYLQKGKENVFKISLFLRMLRIFVSNFILSIN